MDLMNLIFSFSFSEDFIISLRSIIDKYKKLYQNHRDYIIILRKNCHNLDFQELEDSFLQLFEKVNKEPR